MKYNYYAELLRRTRSGEMRKAEVRSDWTAFSPALVLTFRYGEEKAVRHTHWMPFLNEVYVRQLMDPEQYAWARQLAKRAKK